MKVPLDTGFPDYDPDDPEIDFRKKRWDYWNVLKNLRVQFLSILDPTFVTQEEWTSKFAEYVTQQYGIRIIIVDGKITDRYDIVDEKLYTYFILKWR